jgi:hypothetical protein
MFRKKQEITEGELLRDALRHKDTTVTVTSSDGRRWTLCNDTAAECSLKVKDIVVSETRDKKDILTDFWVRAKNGRLG